MATRTGAGGKIRWDDAARRFRSSWRQERQASGRETEGASARDCVMGTQVR